MFLPSPRDDGIKLEWCFREIKLRQVLGIESVKQVLLKIITNNPIVQNWCHQINTETVSEFNRLNNALLV